MCLLGWVSWFLVIKIWSPYPSYDMKGLGECHKISILNILVRFGLDLVQNSWSPTLLVFLIIFRYLKLLDLVLRIFPGFVFFVFFILLDSHLGAYGFGHQLLIGAISCLETSRHAISFELQSLNRWIILSIDYQRNWCPRLFLFSYFFPFLFVIFQICCFGYFCYILQHIKRVSNI